MTSDAFEGKAEWFDRHYESTRGRVRFRVLREQLKEALPPPPVSVLDAGGGPGRFSAALAADGYSVTLLDPSEEMLERARRALSGHGDARIVRGTAEEAPALFGRERFDAVLLHAVVCYTEDLDAVLGGVAATLKQGGVLSLVFKNRDALPFRHAIEGRLAEAVRALEGPCEAGNLGIVNRARTRGELERALSRAGFAVRSVRGVRLFSEFLTTEPEEEKEVEQLVNLELRAGAREPYRSVARLCHLVCELQPAS